jgi:hypothetical protein
MLGSAQHLSALAGRGRVREADRVRGRVRATARGAQPLTLAPLRSACLGPDKRSEALSPRAGRGE